MNAARPEGPNGPTAAPGKYTVRLTSENWTFTKPFTVIEDPRVTRSGVTTQDLIEQLNHNLRVLALVSDVNRAVGRVRAAQASLRGNAAEAQKLAKLNELASHLITPSIRYSKPELQTHITYLYSLTTATDQKVGQDAVDRYAELRKNLDLRVAELNGIWGRRSKACDWMRATLGHCGLQDSIHAQAAANAAALAARELERLGIANAVGGRIRLDLPKDMQEGKKPRFRRIALTVRAITSRNGPASYKTASGTNPSVAARRRRGSAGNDTLFQSGGSTPNKLCTK